MAERPLVVGANGQVGRELVRQLGEGVVPAGRTAAEEGWAQLDLTHIADDVDAAARILDAIAPTAIYCVGGATDVERCESEPEWADSTNARGPSTLAKAARGIPFVFFSTDYVFDGNDGPYDEEAPTNPLSAYGKSKLRGEQGVLDAHPDALIVRTTVVYGFDAQQKNFLYALRRLLSAGTVMNVPEDQISSPTLNQDLAAATIELVRSGANGIYNVSGPEAVSRYDFALAAAAILGLDASLIRPRKTSELNQIAPRPLRAGFRIDKIKAKLPHVLLHDPASGIRVWAHQS